MISRATQEWPEGTAIEITGEEMTINYTEIESRMKICSVFQYLLIMCEGQNSPDEFDFEWYNAGWETLENFYNKLRDEEMIKRIERRPMSQWTKYDMDTYNRLTGQGKK